jgi:hypothetical protein
VGGNHANGRTLDCRTISFTGSITLSVGSPRIIFSRFSTSTSPALRVSCSTVVSGGLAKRAIGMSSKPATGTSAGTL